MPAFQTECAWITTVTRAAGDQWPDATGSYGTKPMRIRPQRITVAIRASEGEAPQRWYAQVHGPRIRADGSPGKETSYGWSWWADRGFLFQDPPCPDWVAVIATAEFERVGGDTPTGKPFRPDWCLAPAVLLREWIDENRVSAAWVGRAAGRTPAGAGEAGMEQTIDRVRQVLAGEPLHEDHAAVLEAGTGVRAAMWLRLEHNYRAGLAVGLTDVTSSPREP